VAIGPAAGRLVGMWRRHPHDPEAVAAAIRGNVAHWHALGPDEQGELVAGAEWLLARKHWESAGGLVLDDTVRGVVAGLASLLVLGLGVDHLREVGAVVVYPTTVVTTGERPGPVPGTRTQARQTVHGLAADHRGPVLIAWDQAIAAARRPARNHNVVLHEFAHKLDQLDGIMDGTPPLDEPLRSRWVAVCQRTMDELRLGIPHPPLRGYAATNPTEFFSVATEAFFDRPLTLREREPELYALLEAFYRQDPATRIEALAPTG
jgi:hypothetical protein